MFNKGKHQDTAQRFTIKKFKFGAASVLIGTVFAVFAGGVQAEEIAASTDSSASVATTVASESTSETAVTETTVATPEVVVAESATPASSETVEVPASTETSTTAESTVASSETATSTEEKAAETTATETAKPATESSASTSASQAVAVERVAAAPYKVTYTDVANNEVVYSTNHSVVEKTTAPATERATFNVTATSQVGTAPALEGYKLAEGQAAVQAGIVTERGGRNNIINFNVVKDDVAAAAGPDNEEGYTGFRAIADSTAQASQPAAGSGSAYDPTADNAVPRRTVTMADYLATQSNPMDGVTSPFGESSANLYNSNFSKIVRFLNFTQANVVSGAFGANNRLTEGMVFQEEIYPGMVVRATVMELKPFRATDEYLEMATEIDRINGTNYATTVYDSTATNKTRRGADAGIVPVNNMNDSVISAGSGGLKTGTQAVRLMGTPDGTDVGVKLKLERVKADGSTTPVNIFVADGEQLTNRELISFTTNGTPWTLAGEYRQGNYSWIPNNSTLLNDGIINESDDVVFRYSPYTDVGIVGQGRYPNGTKPNPQAFINPYPNAGLGTQVFSSSVNYLYSYPGKTNDGNLSVPVVASEGVSELGIYINSAGRQSALMGFIIADRSDAPETYGQAIHGASTISGDGTTRQVPSLGRVSADIDKMLGADAVLTGFYGDDDRQGENDNVNADEGEAQLAKDGLYQVVDASSSSYTLTVVANANGPATASAKAWIDFNNNGVFDDNEGSAVQSFSGTSESTLTFTWTGLDLSGLDVSKLGARIRVGTATDVARPTGMAATGEVEDFQVAVKYPPKGSYDETTGLQGQAQTGNVTFTPQGKQIVDGVTVREQTDTANTMIDSLDTSKVGIVDPATGNLVQTLTVAGQGTYTILPSSTGASVQVQFQPEASFIGRATGVVIRSTDVNGLTSGWTTGGADKSNSSSILPAGQTWDSLYIPNVTMVRPTATPATTTGKQGETQTQDATTMFTEGAEVVPINNSSITLLDAQGNPTKTVTVEGQGTYTVDENGQISFTPLPGFTGTATPVSVRAADVNGSEVTTTYTPSVTPITPTATPAETTNKQGVPQTQDAKTMFTEGDASAPINNSTITLVDSEGNPTKSLTVEGQGTYTVDENGVITFTPLPEFTGTAKPVTVKATDKNGTPVSTTYTPTVTPVKPTATPAETTGPQGQSQTQDATTMFTAGDTTAPINEDSITLIDPKTGNPTKSVTIEGQGTYTVDENGVITFTPVPEFTGTATPVTVKATDKNGTPVSTTYTPTVTPVKPTATPAETAGLQGQSQTQDATTMFTEGDTTAPINEDSITLIDPKTGNPTKSVTIEGQGTYTVDENGVITFTPVPEFTGTATPVTVKATDKNGTPVSTTYTPTVTPVKPTATPAETTGLQGQSQTQDATMMFTEGDTTAPINEDSITLIDPKTGNPTKSVTIEGQGTYTVDENGQITFTPVPEFTGTATPVTVKATDKNGTPVSTTYTPTVTPVKPTATPAETTGLQGQSQTQDATSMFTEGDTTAPINEDSITLIDPKTGNPTKSVTIEGQGTYTVDENGVITFTPVPEFTGTATPVTVKATDKNGTPVSTTYTPTVTPVKPTATPAETTGLQGQSQTTDATSMFTEGDTTAPINNDSIRLIDPKTGNPTRKVTVEGQGTYTIDANGQITFTPVPEFTGTANPVTVKATDKNGTPVTTTYTPTVTPIKPTATPAETSGKQGQSQTTDATSMFTEGDTTAPINNDSIRLIDPKTGQPTNFVTVPGEGTYTIDKNGQITFTPDTDFTGTATPITVRATDKNGTPVTTTYTPTVTPVTTNFVDEAGKPLAPEGTGKQPSQTISGYEVVSSTTDEEGNTVHVYRQVTNPVTSFVDEKGTPIAPQEDGKQPSQDISGYKLVSSNTDKDGNVTHTYTKVTENTTSFVDEKGNPILPNEDGSQPSKAVSGYKLVSSTTDENGNTVHTYRKVEPVTSFVDENGYVIVPNEDGSQPSKDLPEYELVSSSIDENGNTVHVYRKVVKPTTSFVDEEGNVVSPQEDGKQPSKNLPDYELVSSKTDDKGNVVHTYRKVAKPTTSFVDEEGNVVSPQEDGTQPSKALDGYEFVKTATDKAGNTVHIYRKVEQPTTSFVDETGKELSPSVEGNVGAKAIDGYELVTTKDENGNTVHVYRKVVTPVEPEVAKPTTSFVDETGKELSPSVEGNVAAKAIDGYELVTTKDENGNTVHVYRKVVTPAEPEVAKPTTSFVDETGKELSPSVEGNVGAKAIDGYELVTTKDENGNTVHVYRKVVAPAEPEVAKPTTSFVDETGKELSPSVEGNVAAKAINGYELVTTKDENGNTVHVYRKVVAPAEPEVAKPTTSFVDETGKELSPSVEGNVAAKAIDGYELVTTKDENGNTVHVYRKVATPVAPKHTAKPMLAPSAEAQPATKTENKLEVLPNTGTENTATASALGVGMILTALGLAGKRRRKED